MNFIEHDLGSLNRPFTEQLPFRQDCNDIWSEVLCQQKRLIRTNFASNAGPD